MSKHCPTCDTTKADSEFGKDRRRADGLRGQCKVCKEVAQKKWRAKNPGYHAHKSREYAAKNPEKVQRTRRKSALKVYGITPAEYDRLLREQGGACALCREGERGTDPRTGQPRRLAVDHCHETGRVRGLLCLRCNQALGTLGDTAEGLYRAYQYVKGDTDGE